jgi:hypothetical protein
MMLNQSQAMMRGSYLVSLAQSAQQRDASSGQPIHAGRFSSCQPTCRYIHACTSAGARWRLWYLIARDVAPVLRSISMRELERLIEVIAGYTNRNGGGTGLGCIERDGDCHFIRCEKDRATL